MAPPPELIEAPLTGEELGLRYRALCEDPVYAAVPGKVVRPGRRVPGRNFRNHGAHEVGLFDRQP